MGSSPLPLTCWDLRLVWRRCLMVLSACRQLYWRSARVHWALFVVLGHNYRINFGWPCVHALWCSSWLYYILLEVIFFLSRPQFAWWVPSQRQLSFYITAVPPWTWIADVEFHGLLCWLEFDVVLASRVSHMVFLVRILHSLPACKKILDGRVFPHLNCFVLIMHWPWFDFKIVEDVGI